MKQKLLLTTGLLAFSLLGQAQTKTEKNAEDGTDTYVFFGAEKKEAKNTAKALREHFKKDGVTEDFEAVSSETDAMGYTFTRHQQKYRGISVENGVYITHAKGGQIVSMSGDFVAIAAGFSTKPNVVEAAALEAAKSYVGGTEWMWNTEDAAQYYKKNKGSYQPTADLVIIKTASKGVKLAYKFDIYSTAPAAIRTHVYVDAQTNEILGDNPIIHHVAVPGTLATRYSGTRTATVDQVSSTSFRLRDPSRGSGVNTYNMRKGTRYTRAVDFTDANNQWVEYNNTNKDNAALDAHIGAQATYDYFKAVLGRNSFNNTNGAINSYVHYSTNYVNAFWDGSRMTYGDGNGTSFDPLTSMDVCAHEIGHGVCTFSANLAYQRESGALNEAFSDIWGACVEQWYEAQNSLPSPGTWAVGEDFDLRNVAVKGFRSMSNPNAFGHPDTYGGLNWRNPNCGTPTSTNDYCGVHSNSGVLNYCFYLMSVGGTGTNDIGNAFTVTGIGITDAAKIAYRAETTKLSANSTYAQARTAFIQSAVELFGANSQQERTTTNAFYAVGVGAAHPNGARLAAPENLESVDATENEFNATWNKVAEASEYEVQIWTGQGWKTLATTFENFVKISDIDAGAQVAWRVVAKDQEGNTGDSKTKITDLSKNLNSKLEISLYPNPSADAATLNFTTKNAADVYVQVVDINGRTFIQKNDKLKAGNNSINLNISSLNKGMYFVKVLEKQTNAPYQQNTRSMVIK